MGLLRCTDDEGSRERFLVAILLVVLTLPLSGCHQSIVAMFDPDVEMLGHDLDENVFTMDPRASLAIEESEADERVASEMLSRERIAESKVAASGLVERRLSAAGITAIDEDELIGMVVDSDLQPIPGAAVVDRGYRSVEGTTTDDDGIFRLRNCSSDDRVPLIISKAGYSPRIFMACPECQKFPPIILGKLTCLQGVVTGPDGKPVSGARIIASCGPFQFRDPHRWSMKIPFETTSDVDGRYRLAVCPSKYEINVTAPGIGVAHQTRVLVESNQTVERPIQLAKGTRLEATVVDSETGRPFEGFVLSTRSLPSMSARSDAQGKLVLEDQFLGRMAYHCDTGSDAKDTDESRFGGSLGRWWSHDAIDMDGQPIRPSAAALLLLGKAIPTPWPRDFGLLTFDIKPGMKPVKILVERAVTLTGIVSDPEGHPVEGATVGAALSPKGMSLGGHFNVTTDNAGRYRAVLPASQKHKYALFAHDGAAGEWRNWANGVSSPLQTKPGQVIENIDIKLTVPGVIRGRLTDGGVYRSQLPNDNKPTANRTIYSHSIDGCENSLLEPKSTTDDDGSFELKFVRPGKHYVLIYSSEQPDKNAKKNRRVVEVKAGEVVENVEPDFTSDFDIEETEIR